MPEECQLVVYPQSALSLADANELKANRNAWKHACLKEQGYLVVAKGFLDLAGTLAGMNDSDLRVNMVAEWIKAMDSDVWGLTSDTMGIDRLCELLARSVVGREIAAASTTNE
jgi:hypothetical protein